MKDFEEVDDEIPPVRNGDDEETGMELSVSKSNRLPNRRL